MVRRSGNLFPDPLAMARIHPGWDHDDMTALDLIENRQPKRSGVGCIVDWVVLWDGEVPEIQRSLS